MWIVTKNTESSLLNWDQSTNSYSDSISWVETSVSKILNSNQLNSPNFIIWKRLLKEKLQSWNIAWISTLLMDILTFRPEFFEEKYWNNEANFLLDLKQRVKLQSDYYKKVIDKIEKQSEKDWILTTADNPAWFSLKTKNYFNQQNWLNFKLYLTIPIKWYDFISKIYQLWIMLNDLAQQSWDKLSLKIPSSILWFLSHSDSLVIHFKNIENKEKIEKILEEWRNKNWIVEESRNLWRTKFAWDPIDNSFSGLIANNIEKWILENYWKYDNELIANLAMEHTIKQSQTPPKFKQ